MCGIFAYLGKRYTEVQLREHFQKIAHRGPDSTKDQWIQEKLWFGFHRLAINGLDSTSDQPLHLFDDVTGESYYLICNGEIYNCHLLAKEHNIEYRTLSDCEVILHLYRNYGFQDTLELLDGVFSIILYDSALQRVFVANDPLGIRPLYWTGDHQEIFFASEPIALTNLGHTIKFYPPGHCSEYNLSTEQVLSITPPRRFAVKYQTQHLSEGPVYPQSPCDPTDSFITGDNGDILSRLRSLVIQAVQKRMMSNRPIACLLSGGLDSSLIAAILASELKLSGKALENACYQTPEIRTQQNLLKGKLHTFSIGMPGSPDLKYAKMVADHIGSIHHHLEVPVKKFLAAIPEVIKAIGTWDTTTIRASVGNYLIAKYIKENTDFVVIFNGDVSEEINGSYYYAKFAPNPLAFLQDNQRLLREVYQYDVLRSARSVEHFSLESRTPFADKDLVDFVMKLHPLLKMFEGDNPIVAHIEKNLLRKAFAQTSLLPLEVLWRPKTAFSDGVSEKTKSWHQIIADWVDNLISDWDLQEDPLGFKYHCPPRTKEEYYYRKIFEEHYPGQAKMIKGYWMPRFVKDVTDPSARVLSGNQT